MTAEGHAPPEATTTSGGAAAAPPPVVRDLPTTRRLEQRRRRRRQAVGGGALGAVAVVAILLLTGVLPWLRPSAPPSAVPFSQARPAALHAVPSLLLPQPVLLVAFAIDARNATALAPSAFSNNTTANCTLTPLPDYPASGKVVVPAYSGSFASGDSPFWVFVFESGSGGPFVLVAVVNASATALAELSGANCGTGSTVPSPLPTDVVDSPAAAVVAWNVTGAAYLAGHPNATTLTLTAYGGTSSGFPTLPPLWLFAYAPCSPLSGGTVNVTARVAAVGLVSGSFYGSTPVSVGCPA